MVNAKNEFDRHASAYKILPSRAGRERHYSTKEGHVLKAQVKNTFYFVKLNQQNSKLNAMTSFAAI